jgi:hypothetical protein
MASSAGGGECTTELNISAQAGQKVAFSLSTTAFAETVNDRVARQMSNVKLLSYAEILALNRPS